MWYLLHIYETVLLTCTNILWWFTVFVVQLAENLSIESILDKFAIPLNFRVNASCALKDVYNTKQLIDVLWFNHDLWTFHRNLVAAKVLTWSCVWVLYVQVLLQKSVLILFLLARLGWVRRRDFRAQITNLCWSWQKLKVPH